MEDKKYFMIASTAGEICDLIEKEMARIGRNLTNEEVNNLLTDAAVNNTSGQVLAVSDKPIDSDILTGDLREEGVKVLNLNEEIRKEEMQKKKDDTKE